MTAFVGLNCDVLQIILNLIDSRDCQTQDGLALCTQKPLKALALVNRKLTSMVQPRLFTDLSVSRPYKFAVTFVDGPSKPKPTDFAKCARRMDINSTYDFSGSKKLLAGYEVSFNFPNRLTKLQTLHISMLPCFGLTTQPIKQKLPLRISTIAYPTTDCEGFELLKFCPNVSKLDIVCNKRDGYCYVAASAKQLSKEVSLTKVETLSCDCYGCNVQEWPDMEKWAKLCCSVKHLQTYLDICAVRELYRRRLLCVSTAS